MRKITQKERIKQILLQHQSITSWDAFKVFGITRLSAIIHELRHKENMDIKSEPITNKNRYGDKVVFYKYFID